MPDLSFSVFQAVHANATGVLKFDGRTEDITVAISAGADAMISEMSIVSGKTSAMFER